MRKVETIGVIGGMGPDATNRLCQLITELTPAATDQQHIPVITFNNSSIPSRVDAIFDGAMSPLPELIRTARSLESIGATFLLMPCNTAHYYLNELQRCVSVPILNMIEETVKYTRANFPNCTKIGLLASTPTIECRMYHRAFSRYGVSVFAPDAKAQSELVMQSIFGPEGLKAGSRNIPKQNLIKAGQQLIGSGAEVVIAGCTEISLVLEGSDVPFTVVDPLQIIAQVAINRALNVRMIAVDQPLAFPA